MVSNSVRRAGVSIRDCAILFSLFMGVTPSYALIQTSGCVGGDFGDECSLAELINNYDAHFIRVDNLIFRYFIFTMPSSGDNPVDNSRIKVVPVGEGTTQPGLRFESNGQWAYTPGLYSIDRILRINTDFSMVAAGYNAAKVLSITVDPQASGLSSHVTESGSIEGIFMTGFFRYTNIFGAGQFDQYWGIPAVTPGGGPYSGSNVLPPVTHEFTGTPSTNQGGVTSYIALWSRQTNGGSSEITSVTITAQLEGLHPPLPPSQSAGAINNGTFTSGLNNWTSSGSGTVGLTEVSGGTVAVLDATGGSTALCTPLETPLTSFMVDYDYRATEATGTLEVSIKPTAADPPIVIETVAAVNTVQPQMTHRRVLINDPALMGHPNAQLCFEALPGSPSVWELGNIDSPVFQTTFRKIAATASIHFGGISTHLAPASLSLTDMQDTSAGVTIPETQDEGDFGYCGFWASARARGAADSFTGGLEWGSAGAVRVLPLTVPWSPYADVCRSNDGPTAHSETDATHLYLVNATGSAGPAPYPLGYKLSVSGRVTVVGSEDALQSLDPPADAHVRYSVRAHHMIRRAATEYIKDLSYEGALEIVNGAVYPGASLQHGRVVIPGDPDPRCGMADSDDAVQLIDSQIGASGQIIRTYDVFQVYCLEPVLQVDPGAEVQLTALVRLDVSATEQLGAESLFEGVVDADFDETVTMELFSSVPDLTFELQVPPPVGVNTPPTADAGADQTVEATGPAGALVMFDGTGSSDPDEGDTLSYTWTDSFGSVGGISPQVLLGLGSHTVTLTVVDAGGLSNTDTVDVTVEDTTPPSVTAPPDLVIAATGPLTAVDLDPDGLASASDLVDGALVPSPDQSGPFAPGSYEILWTAQDNAGNSGSATQQLQVRFDFQGFLVPVANLPIMNTVQAGQGVALKWSIPDGAGGYVRDLGVVSGVQYEPVACADGAVVEENLLAADTSGQSGLRYDTLDEQYVYVWKTPRSLSGTCADAVVTLTDESEHRARFSFR